MIDVKELMAKVGKIRILTNRLVDDRLSGDYHSTFKGQGVEFDEVRPYVAGDDIRSIDWNVTARMGEPFIKRFSEERELTVLFMVDVSGSQAYGSTEKSKAEIAAEVTSLLALTAIRNQDKIGLILFSDRIVKYIPPRKGRQSVMRLVREVLAGEGESTGGTDVAGALKFLNGVQKKKAVVFLVSDFLIRHQADEVEKILRVTARHHDMIAIPVSDPAESQLPNVGLVELEDAETGELVLVDTSSKSVRDYFAKKAEEERSALMKFFMRTGIDKIMVSTDKEYIHEVRALFKRRSMKR